MHRRGIRQAGVDHLYALPPLQQGPILDEREPDRCSLSASTAELLLPGIAGRCARRGGQGRCAGSLADGRSRSAPTEAPPLSNSLS